MNEPTSSGSTVGPPPAAHAIIYQFKVSQFQSMMSEERADGLKVSGEWEVKDVGSD